MGMVMGVLGTYRTDGVGDDLDVDVGHDVSGSGFLDCSKVKRECVLRN
jgi:hypothetical protein